MAARVVILLRRYGVLRMRSMGSLGVFDQMPGKDVDFEAEHMWMRHCPLLWRVLLCMQVCWYMINICWLFWVVLGGRGWLVTAGSLHRWHLACVSMMLEDAGAGCLACSFWCRVGSGCNGGS
jgi:hypothetical protein